MESSDKICMHQHRDFGGVINAAFDFIRMNGLMILKMLAIFAIPFLAFGFALFFYSIGGEQSHVGLMLFAIFLITAGISLFNFSIYAFMDHYMKFENPQDIRIKDIWKTLSSRIGAFIGTAIVSGLIVGISSMFMTFPGIILYTYLSFVLPVIIFENGGTGKAISRSFQLVGGKFWYTLGLSTLLFLIEFMFWFLIDAPMYLAKEFGIIKAYSILHIDYTIVGWDYAIMAIYTFVQYSMFSMIWIVTAVAFTFHYFSIREDREHIGMRMEIEKFGTHSDEDEYDY